MKGTVADGFEPVRDVFEENFERRDEVGAACAVYHRGEKVVDLWGGTRDVAGDHPWEEDTMVMVFSGTKGMAAAATALGLSRGLFDLDDAIADHWPEFGAHGKGDITVRQLLAHRAGLATVDATLSPADLADHDGLATLLADRDTDWDPGTRHGYHAFTLGWYQSELFRRTDGRTLGQFFAEEVADPLDLEFYIGLPDTVADDRVAELEAYTLRSLLRHLDTMPVRMVLSLFYPRSIASRTLDCLATDSPGDINSPPFRSVEIPSANGIGTARSMARLYGDLSTGGERLGLSPSTFEELTAPPGAPSGGLKDVVIRVQTAYAMGFSRPSPDFQFGRSHRAFGTPGAGGAFGFADPDAELGFAYTPNRMGVHLKDDPREVALRDAVYRCLDRAGSGR